MPEASPESSPLHTRPRARIRPAVWWFGLAGCALTAVVSSLLAYQQGLPPVVAEVAGLDKVLHFGVFGAIAFFLDGVLERRMLRLGERGLPLAAVLVLVPAGIEEYLQRYSANRSSNVADWLADLAGVTVLVWLSRRVS